MQTEHQLKKYRKLRFLTQEELSESSGISIRTIQRIEKGLSTGNAHTLKTLAKTLDVEISDLLCENNNRLLSSHKDLRKLKLMNLSVLTVLFLPFGNIIIPWIIFYRNKDDMMVNTLGRKIISFQMIWLLILPFFMISMFFVLGRGNGSIPLGVFVPYLIYMAVNILVSIHTAIRINSNKEFLRFIPNIL